MEAGAEDRVHITIQAASADELRVLLREEDLDLNCGGVARTAAGAWIIEAYVSRDQADRLSRRAGYAIEIDEDFAARTAERRAEVGGGDQFQGGRTAPQGLGRKE